VSKRFDTAIAVERVSLDIFSGEFFALLGPSGCGKTTLLRLLAGLEMPDEGRILLDGADLATVPPYRRPINMMFQSYALFPHLTVEQNIAFGLKQERMPRPQIAARVAEMLALVRLEGFNARKPEQLSGGERQRVAIARALANEPLLLLADEPTGALDSETGAQIVRLLLALRDQRRMTVLLVTNDESVSQKADRVLRLRDGSVELARLDAPSSV
jgi:putrescine transport system ATP-binding protein